VDAVERADLRRLTVARPLRPPAGRAVAASDLTRLSTEDLNRPTSRFDWFLVRRDDDDEGWLEISNGLVSRTSPAGPIWASAAIAGARR
jgi:hypothetical protein